jgi:hypothetical protein
VDHRKHQAIVVPIQTQPVPQQALYITGDSVGGAMAAMNARLLSADRPPHTEPYSKKLNVRTPMLWQPTFSDHELTGAVISPTFSGQRFSAVAAKCWR